jgi:hypothetical protein
MAISSKVFDRPEAQPFHRVLYVIQPGYALD